MFYCLHDADKLQFADVKYYQMVFDQNNQKTVALKLQRHQSPDVDSKGYVSGTLKITLMEGKHKGELACPHIKLSLVCIFIRPQGLHND